MHGFRYRLHVKDLLSKPDIVLPKYKTIIFVQGCYWHGHKGCKYFVMPKTGTEWWSTKITENIERDILNKQISLSDGSKVIEIREGNLRGSNPQLMLSLILSLVKEK